MVKYIEGPQSILVLVDNLSRLHCLPTPSQLLKGKKLVEPALFLMMKTKRRLLAD